MTHDEMIEAVAKAIGQRIEGAAEDMDSDWYGGPLWRAYAEEARAAIRVIAPAVLEEAAESKWKSIETAPKDGTVIDIWVAGLHEGVRVPNAYWSDEGFSHGPMRTDGEPGWAAENMGYDGCDGYADDPDEGVLAIHWMPLPTPPAPSHPARRRQ